MRQALSLTRIFPSHRAVWQGHHVAHSALSLRSNKGSLRAQLSLGKEEEVSVWRFGGGGHSAGGPLVMTLTVGAALAWLVSLSTPR